MRVGVLTFQWAPNYGAVLQALGLQTALLELGHQPVFIEYVPPYLRRRISPIAGWGFNSGPRFFSKFRLRLHEHQRRKGFRRFKEDRLTLSPKLRNRIALRDYCAELDAVIVGSDQVWNLHWQKTFDDTYFLGFLDGLDKRVRRIAYAPCFGSPDQPMDHLLAAKEHIARFDAIGMRNQFGIDLVGEMEIGLPRRVVDPAFFLPRVKRRVPPDPRIAIYAVCPETASLCSRIVGCAQSILQNVSVCQLSSENPVPVLLDGLKTLRYADPSQWLDVVSNSQFLCSESFHGAVFALANDVPFVAASSGRRAHRIRDLLARYGSADRLFEEDFGGIAPEVLRHLVTQGANVGKLHADITASKAFLSEALNT